MFSRQRNDCFPTAASYIVTQRKAVFTRSSVRRCYTTNKGGKSSCGGQKKQNKNGDWGGEKKQMSHTMMMNRCFVGATCLEEGAPTCQGLSASDVCVTSSSIRIKKKPHPDHEHQNNNYQMNSKKLNGNLIHMIRRKISQVEISIRDFELLSDMHALTLCNNRPKCFVLCCILFNFMLNVLGSVLLQLQSKCISTNNRRTVLVCVASSDGLFRRNNTAL